MARTPRPAIIFQRDEQRGGGGGRRGTEVRKEQVKGHFQLKGQLRGIVSGYFWRLHIIKIPLSEEELNTFIMFPDAQDLLRTQCEKSAFFCRFESFLNFDPLKKG